MQSSAADFGLPQNVTAQKESEEAGILTVDKMRDKRNAGIENIVQAELPAVGKPEEDNNLTVKNLDNGHATTKENVTEKETENKESKNGENTTGETENEESKPEENTAGKAENEESINKEAEGGGSKPEKNTAGETENEEIITEENTTGKTENEESINKETETEESKPEENTAGETETGESKPEENTAGETENEESKPEEAANHVKIIQMSAVLDSVSEPVYISGEEGRPGHFAINVNGSAHADFEAAGIKDGRNQLQEGRENPEEGSAIGEDRENPEEGSAIGEGRENPEEGSDFAKGDLNEIKSALAAQCRLELRMVLPSGNCETLERSGLSVEDGSGSMGGSVSCPEVSLTETGIYQLYAVLIVPDGTEYESDRAEISITIPDPIQVEVTGTKLQTCAYTECKEEDICTGFEIPYTVTAQISLTGLSDDVAAEQRESEISYCLSQYKICVKEDSGEFCEDTLQKEDVIQGLIRNNGAAYAYTAYGSVKVDSAGEHVLHAAVNNVEAAACQVHIAKLQQRLCYTLDKNDRDFYRFDETALCTQAEGIYIGERQCFESNQDGEEIIGITDKKLTLEEDDKSCRISADNRSCRNQQTCYITISHAGNQIYRPASQTIAVVFERIAPQITYHCDAAEDVHRYQTTLTYTIPDFVDADRVECCEVIEDSNGTVTKANNLEIRKNGREITIYHENQQNQESSVHALMFAYKGDSVYRDEKQIISLHFARLENNICYISDSIGDTHEYGEVITYTYQSGDTAGGITCYESDAEGNPVSGPRNLYIENGKYGSFQVKGTKLSDADQPFYVTIAHAENEIYNGARQTFAFPVVKVKLEGSITVNDAEKNYIFFKTRKMYIDVTVKASNGNLPKEDADKIRFRFQVLSSPTDVQNMNAHLVKISYQNDKAVYRYQVSEECARALRGGESYAIRAVADYSGISEKEIYYQEFSKVFDTLSVQQRELEIQVQKELTVELNNQVNQLDFKVTGEKTEGTERFPVSCRIEAKDPSVIAVCDDGTYRTLTGGSTTLTITADDSSEYDLYKECSAEVQVTVQAPGNTDYTLNGQDPQTFLENPHAAAEGEKWYGNDIVLRFGENNLYDELYYRRNGRGEWIHVNGRQFVISESMPTTYEFYFCDTERKVASCIMKGNKAVEGRLEVMPQIGVDTTAPSWNAHLTADKQPSVHSTQAVSYFPTGIVLTGCAGEESETGQFVDSGSGICELHVQYGDETVWEVYPVSERYSRSYGIAFNENKNYGTVRIKAVDYLGHESELAEYAQEICVDDGVPKVAMTAIAIDKTGITSDYDGSWTNQQLRFVLGSLDDTQVSGIYCYEYAFIPRGSKTKLTQAVWKPIDKDELVLVFGTMYEHTQETKEGTFLYAEKEEKSSDIKTSEIKPSEIKPSEQKTSEQAAERTVKEYVQMNGTLYIRAESNAGLVTMDEDIRKNQQQVRIWQQDLEEARVTASIRPDSGTGWYNKETGPVTLSFEYPEYDAEHTAPAVGIVYTLAVQTEKDGEAATVQKTFYKGIINESSRKVIEVRDYKDEDSRIQLAEDGKIQIDKDSMNTLTVYIEDAAGNRSDKTVFQINADYTAPQNLSAEADGADLLLHMDGQESILYRKFSQNSVRVSAHAEYGISGKKSFYMVPTKEQGAKESLSSDNVREELVMEPCSRGIVYLCATDGAGNCSEAWTDGIVVDNLAPAGIGCQEISITAEGQKEQKFYNKDIPVSIRVADAPDNDNYSGLKSVTYSIGRDAQHTKENVSLFDSSENSLSWEQIEKSKSFETNQIVIDAAENESSNAYITVTATDNAGNSTTTTQEFQIDVTPPQVEITFDQNDAVNGTYYHSSRIARIDITERNFDPEQVFFQIYRDGQKDNTLIPSASDWIASEGWVNTAYITFADDGDYSLVAECTDLAGNQSDIAAAPHFTIDQTKPVAEIVYDNNRAWNGNYYHQERTAFITVTEHNFDEKDFAAVITPHASVSGWTHHGDVHKASIRFDSEEYYSYSIDYTDLAGNKMEAFAAEAFYIDMSQPEIQITGVADHSANAGEVIPVVTIADANYDPDSVQITLQNSKGQEIDVNRSGTEAAGEYRYTLTNVNEQPDEIYTISAAASDMAGNTSELSCMFSLNRNGSVYDLSRISALREKAFIRYEDMQDLEIKEMNVNTVETFGIYVTRNGEMIPCTEKNVRGNQEAADMIYYDMQEKGNDETGYEYEYTIYKESFRQEGIYHIMFYSKDKAGNEVNNTLTEKAAELAFVIDNTAPTVVVEGVEAGVLYSEETKDINVYVSDNFKLQEAYFELVEEGGKVLETYDYMELAKEDREIVTITLPGSGKKLSIQYYAADAAGNETSTLHEEAGFMISANAWIRYRNNKKAIAGTIAVCAAPVSAAGIFFRKRRKLLQKL